MDDLALGGYLANKITLLNGRLYTRTLAQHSAAKHTASQGKILYYLWANSSASPSEIAEATGLAPNTLSRMIEDMREKGLLTITIDPNNKRRKIVGLTKIGQAEKPIADEVSQAVGEQFYEGFTPSQRAELIKLLQQVVQNLEEALDN